MWKMGFGGLIALGIIVQIVFLLAIFDIYFKSPIVHGVVPVVNNIPAASQRVVVISVDGLRLDALLENDPSTNKPIAPFIREIMSKRNHSRWGVSHCHLPTESRPGHVAMLAGFYEDPSAVTKGWKENPVDFDSIFNQSVCSFAWGSPDIVNIFYKGLKHNCSFKWTYKDDQNFAGNTMELDNWVLRELENFFNSNYSNYAKRGSLFFLHLLGQDTSGHTHKPKTELYRKNLKNVDEIVEKVEKMFGNFFKDNETTFVLTADHGMTDWGSHGAGDLSETLTPIVLWGSGAGKRSEKLEINQADITPLLAILLGVSIPVNSIGILPIDFLNMTQARISEALLLNALQLSSQFLALKSDLETKSYWTVYKTFRELNLNVLERNRENILEDIRFGRFAEANRQSRFLIQTAMKGIQFYNNYHQKLLFIFIVAGYLLWIFYLIFKLIGFEEKIKKNHIFVIFGIIVINFMFIYSENLPISFNAYTTIPIILFWLIFPNLVNFFKFAANFSINRFIAMAAILVGVEMLVTSFYFRWILSLCFLPIIFWPILQNLQSNLKFLYVFCGFLLGGFTFMPVIGKQPQPFLIILASFTIFGFFFKKNGIINIVRSFLILLAGFNSFYVHKMFENEGKLGLISQTISWLLLLTTPFLLTKTSKNLLNKLEEILMTLAIPFLLLTISHEGFFILILFIHLITWVKIEVLLSSGTLNDYPYKRAKMYGNVVSISDLRCAFIFLAYIYIAFFGLGNLATLNSFDPAWVRCFLTTFSPFTMTFLILLKVIIPFFGVVVAFTAITVWLDVRPFKIFTTVLIYSNIMALNFLFLVKNEGSWLDIGTSLSHYVIQQVSIVFLLVLYFASQTVFGKLNRTHNC